VTAVDVAGNESPPSEIHTTDGGMVVDPTLPGGTNPGNSGGEPEPGIPENPGSGTEKRLFAKRSERSRYGNRRPSSPGTLIPRMKA